MEQERIEKLAEYLEEPVENFKEGYRENIVENTETGEEYFVGNYDESYEAARIDIENVYDDLGLDAFTKDFQDWIIDNALDIGWFEDFLRDSMEGYVEDIEYESDDVFENRLIAEMFDNGILSEDNFENFGKDNPILKDDVDIEEKKEEYIEYLIKSGDDPITYYKYNVGFDNLRDIARKGYGPDIDMDKIVEKCIYLDGIANFVARYDGKEIELDDDLFAYRIDLKG